MLEYLINNFIFAVLKNSWAMGVTRLKRKDRMNKTVSKLRTSAIKRLTKTPVIKKVDIEELKKQAAAQA
jgi:hypothetical protein